jgi:nuclear cap-binding protein subunit 1
VDLPPSHIRKAFITGSLEKEIRLSVAQRIRGTLPEQYHGLVGEEKEKDTPDFKYSDPGMFPLTLAQPYSRPL